MKRVLMSKNDEEQKKFPIVSIKKYLTNVVFNTETRFGYRFALFIQLLIVISLISFAYETLPNLSAIEIQTLDYLELVIVLIFTFEYLSQIWIAEHKLKFIFSFMGLVDLIAILPFYISTGVDLRAARISRLFRSFKLLKYNKALDRFTIAIKSIKDELVLFSIVTLLLLYVAAVGIYFCEHEAQPEHFQSIFHSLWWAIVTLTTVGYGDVYPITLAGRMFTFLLLMLGLAIVSIPAGLLASALVQTKGKTKDSTTKEE